MKIQIRVWRIHRVVGMHVARWGPGYDFFKILAGLLPDTSRHFESLAFRSTLDCLALDMQMVTLSL
jgi:hypothetical protein